MPDRPHLLKIVFEVRYSDGELYWDLSGRVRRTLSTLDKGWDSVLLATPDGHWGIRRSVPATPAGAQALDVSGSFGCLKLDLAAQWPVVTPPLAPETDRTCAIMVPAAECVLSALSIEAITRVGLRMLSFFKFSSRERARTALNRVVGNPWEFGPDLGDETEMKTVQLIDLEGRTARVAVSETTAHNDIQGRRSSHHGILVDVDYVAEPLDGLAYDLNEHFDSGAAYVARLCSAISERLEQ